MNTKILALLMLVPMAFAGFSDVQEDSKQQQNLAYDDPLTWAVFEQEFTHNSTNDVYVRLADTDSPFLGSEGFGMDITYRVNGGAEETLVTGLNDTDATDPIALVTDDVVSMKFNLTFPTERETGLVSVSALIISDDSDGATGNGGTYQYSLGLTMTLYFYDEASDSDQDTLPDAWEMEHFGHLHFLGSDDPDRDGYNNMEEYAAGTAPNDANSYPEEDVITAGGSSVTDRELGALLAGLIFFLVCMVIAVYFAQDQARKARNSEDAWAIGLGISGGITLIAVTVLFVLDVFDLGNQAWAFWAYFGLSWMQYIFAGLVTAAALATTVGIMLSVKQMKEFKFLAGLGFFLLLFGFLCLIVFRIFGVGQ